MPSIHFFKLPCSFNLRDRSCTSLLGELPFSRRPAPRFLRHAQAPVLTFLVGSGYQVSAVERPIFKYVVAVIAPSTAFNVDNRYRSRVDSMGLPFGGLYGNKH